MSFFSTALSRLLQDHTATEISALTGIPSSSLSAYSSGDRGISVGALGNLIEAFPTGDQLELVAAHLRDEMPGNMPEGIEVRIRVAAVAEDKRPPDWARDLEQALDLLALRAKGDPDVRKLVLDLAKVL